MKGLPREPENSASSRPAFNTASASATPLTPQQQALVDRVSRELTGANIPLPAHFNPFPNKLQTEGFLQGDSVVGVSKEGSIRDLIRRVPNEGIFSWEKPCANNKLDKEAAFEANRAYVLMHEITHYIDSKTGLSNPIRDHVGKQISGKVRGEDVREVIKTNVGERLADTAAALYTLSNYPGQKDIIQNKMDFRRMYIDDIAHNTATSVERAVADFAKHPRSNITIVEAAQWANRLLDQQKDNFVPEMLTQNTAATTNSTSPVRALGITSQMSSLDIFMGRAGGSISDHISSESLKKVDQTAIEARQRLCAPDPFKP